MLARSLARPLARSLSRHLAAGEATYAPESVEYFTRARITDGSAKTRVDGFVRGLKTLGLWDSIVYIPCHSDMGGLHQLGGAAQRTNTPWTLSGDYALTTDGVSGTGYNPATFAIANRINPQQQLTSASVAATPTYVGVMASQDHQDTATQNAGYIRHGTFVYNSTALGGFAGTGPYGNSIVGVNSQNAYRLTYPNPVIYRDRNRPYLMAAWLRGSSNQARNLINSNYDAGVTTTTAASLAFSQFFAITHGAPLGSAGKVHGVFYAYCDPEIIGGRTAWQRLWALINSTLFSHKREGGFLRVQLSGQSNASPALAAYLNRDNLCANNTRCTEIWNANQGGQPVTWWVGSGTPTRQAGYGTTIYNGTGTSPLERGRPLNGIGKWRETFVWVQGESDSETRELTNAYASRLTALIGFIRADAGNPAMKFVIGKIGYHHNYRSGSAQGDFTVSGFSGDATVLNGSWAIQAMATATENYVWKKSGYTLIQQNARWEFVRDSDSVGMAQSNTNPAHPYMVATWTVNVGAGTPTISDSRTGRIEGIRAAQQSVADTDGNAVAIDMRNFEYDPADIAHMTAAGYQAFAAGIAAIA
jgi:hypothetical protein